jgi:hypothetical protein
MTDSSLLLGYTDFQKAVGSFLGYGSDATTWTESQVTEVDDLIQSGLRQFYLPIIPGTDQVYSWSFLKPIASLATTANTGDYNLPDDFSGLVDEKLTFAPGDYGHLPVTMIGEGQIRILRQKTEAGRPRFASIRPKANTGAAGQKFEILFYPTPDDAYILSYRYNVQPNKISTISPYPYGGMTNSECILESCLAMAENRSDDTVGLHQAKYQERLAASIRYDQKISTPEYLGYNGDPSIRNQETPERFRSVTVNGVLYGG